MAHRRDYNPLNAIPRPEVVREALEDAERKAQRLRTLLRIAEEIHDATPRTERRETVHVA